MPIVSCEARRRADGRSTVRTPRIVPSPATFGGNLLGVPVKRNQPPIFLTDNMSLYMAFTTVIGCNETSKPYYNYLFLNIWHAVIDRR